MKQALTPERCLEILEESGCNRDVIKHCRVVSELAVRIAENISGADIELVRIGGLLHDLGRARTHKLEHFIEGGKLASELGLPQEIKEIIQRHVGAGISKEEAEELGLPKGDYIPITLEQKIVAHADNLVDSFNAVPISTILEKLKTQKKTKLAEKIKRLHEELSGLAGMNIDELV